MPETATPQAGIQLVGLVIASAALAMTGIIIMGQLGSVTINYTLFGEAH